MDFRLNVTNIMFFGQVKNLTGHFKSTSKYFMEIPIDLSGKTKTKITVELHV